MKMHFNRDRAQEPVYKKAHRATNDDPWAKPFHFEEPPTVWPKSTSLEIDFNTITDSSFKLIEAELPPVQPIQWFLPVTPLSKRCIPIEVVISRPPKIKQQSLMKTVKKATSTPIDSNIVGVDWPDLKAYPCILWSESYKYVGQYVMIKRFGKWIKHHWVAEHDRLTNGRSTRVCGHYTRGKR